MIPIPPRNAPTRRLLITIGLLCLAMVRAHAVEISFYQRGYIEGGRDAATSLTVAAVRAFEAREPEVRVRIVGVPWGQEGDLKLRTALLARRRIDLFRTAADELPGFLPRRGQLLREIDGELTPSDRTDFGPALEAVERDGRHWAWPLWSTAIVMVANPDLFKAANLELSSDSAPWDWTVFVNTLTKLKAARAPDGKPIVPFNAAARPPLYEYAPLLLAHAGLLFAEHPQAGQSLFTAGVADALQRVAELRSAGLVADSFGVDDQPAAQAQFLEGHLALLMTTPGFLKTLATRDMDATVLPPPTGALGHPITTGGLGCFAVVASGDATREHAAQQLARWVTSAEIAGVVPGWYLAPPARGSVGDFYIGPLRSRLRSIVPTARYQNPPTGTGFFNQTVLPNFQGALLGQRTPAEALRRIDTAWQRELGN